MTNMTFLPVAALICVGVFLNGLRFARMTPNPWAGKSLLGQPIEGHDMPVERVRLIGKLQMIAAPVMLLFFVLLTTGVLGPVEFR
jgi:hypothetical protein